jgi:hypothetical protein
MSNGQFSVVGAQETERKKRKQTSSSNKREAGLQKPSSSREQYTDQANEDQWEQRRSSNKVRTKQRLLKMKEKRKIALIHLITRTRNWGQLSPMQLAVQMKYGNVISHQLCTEVVRNVWWKREIHEKVIYAECNQTMCVFLLPLVCILPI